MRGFLVIAKEPGLTSHQVVARLRRILNQKKIGHFGTLDPNAAGVLVVGLGEATRSFQFLEEDRKLYRAEFILGQSTATQDASGKVLTEDRFFCLTLPTLQGALAELTGSIGQLPPMYSAVKVTGRKLYEFARQGLEIERQPRMITVFDWRILNPEPEYSFGSRVYSEIACSRGTYVRTLIHDLGVKLGCGAYMGELVRLKSGKFSLEEALSLNSVAELFSRGKLAEKIIPINEALSHLPSFRLEDDDGLKIRNGGKLSFSKYRLPVQLNFPVKAVDEADEVTAIVELREKEGRRYWQPVKVFHYEDDL